MNKILILDTSVLCTWLRINGKETCGPDNNRWDYERVNRKISDEIAVNTVLVLPLAAIIETGNHIAQCHGDRFALANNFAEFIKKQPMNQRLGQLLLIKVNYGIKMG